MAITGVSTITKSAQEVKASEESSKKTETSEVSDQFNAVLRGVLGSDSATSISEEELFAGVIEERLGTSVGAEAAAAYHEAFAEHKGINTRPDGHVLFEKAAKDALADLEAKGILTKEQSSKVKAEAFKAAQLDDNADALYDGRGSENDPTIAIMNFDAAMLAARDMLKKIDAGEVEVTEEVAATDAGGSETITANGTTVDGAGGFLFKPESDSNGNLVVLLPAQLAGKVIDVVLKDEAGTELDKGVSTGMANPDAVGDREHFRFSKPGASYGQNLTVEVAMQDGSIKTYKIPNPSERYD